MFINFVLFCKLTSFDVIFKLVHIFFGQVSPGWISGSVEGSLLPSFVTCQIHDRPSYQRGDTQCKLQKQLHV